MPGLDALFSGWPLVVFAFAVFAVLSLLLRKRSSTLRSRRSLQRARSRPHVGTAASEEEPPSDSAWDSRLEAWLYRAGIRDGGAVRRFLLFQVVCAVAGVVTSVLVARSGVLATGIEWLREIPGGIGDFLAPVLVVAPWTLVLGISALPIARVRAARRELVKKVDRDLPMLLALLATLVESGLAFDAAVGRVLEGLDRLRPLSFELHRMKAESQAGIERTRCFRRLADRLDVPSVYIFVSAMIHSEQAGGGVAEGLRRQSDEVWNRRREQAIAKAQVMPTKLAIPLTICFLPGIFVYTFGPALAQFVDIAEGVVPALR